MTYTGVLKRDNTGFYLQVGAQSFRLTLQRMPVDAVEKNVIVTGEIEGENNIIAEGVRIDDAYPNPVA